MTKKIDEISIGKRIRKDLGNLDPLMESLRLHGLMNPVLINYDNELIAGHRRLESARKLGWQSIEVRIVDASDEIVMMELEIEENLHRRNLAADELADAYNRLERLKNPSLFRRILRAIANFFARIGKRFSRKK
jgi:ParB family transcriptional regulator, chromosome partitioning protein